MCTKRPGVITVTDVAVGGRPFAACLLTGRRGGLLLAGSSAVWHRCDLQAPASGFHVGRSQDHQAAAARSLVHARLQVKGQLNPRSYDADWFGHSCLVASPCRRVLLSSVCWLSLLTVCGSAGVRSVSVRSSSMTCSAPCCSTTRRTDTSHASSEPFNRHNTRCCRLARIGARWTALRQPVVNKVPPAGAPDHDIRVPRGSSRGRVASCVV